MIIEETIQALEEMLSTRLLDLSFAAARDHQLITFFYILSDSHLNGLIDLETKYRAVCAKIVKGVHDHHKAAEQLNQAYKNVLTERGARSLCKQFPTRLVPKIPALFLDAQAMRL